MDELLRVHKEDYGELKESFESILKRLDAMGAPHVDYIWPLDIALGPP